MTPSQLVNDWLDRENGPPSFAVQGLDLPGARQLLQERDPLFMVEVPSGSFEEATRGLRPITQSLIDRLIRIDELVISDNLHDVLDRGLYNPRLSDLFEKLWFARFQHVEMQNPQQQLGELMKETFEEGTPALRSDAVLFWLTLMGQNYRLYPGQLTMIVQERLDADLVQFLLMSETWHAQGCPLRTLVLS